MTILNRTTLQARDALIISGTQKHLQAVPTIDLNGIAFTPATLVAFVQAQIDAANACTSAKSVLADAVKKLGGVNAKTTPVITGLRAFVRNKFGADNSTVLADFGFSPPKKPTPLTAEAQAEAVAKREATRKARNTMGKKQKKKVKGTVVPVVPASGSPPATPVATASAAVNGAAPHPAT